jgi:hypothetical protein
MKPEKADKFDIISSPLNKEEEILLSDYIKDRKARKIKRAPKTKKAKIKA